jgi:hypothetical protein
MCEKVTRREFGRAALGSAAGFAFLQTLVSACGTSKIPPQADRGIIAPKAAQVVRHWAVELNEMSMDLKEAAITGIRWQEQVERLFGRIELKELLNFIDFGRLKEQLELPDLGVDTKPTVFPRIEGLPENTVFIKKVFGLKKGRAIVPHGHSNMASAHMVLGGSFRLRHYDKIEDTGKGLVIRPTIERTVSAGDVSSISDDRDNVHWFIAESDEAYTFDVIVLDLNNRKYEIHNLDVDSASSASNGDLIAPKIDVGTALKKYGKQHHPADAVSK